MRYRNTKTGAVIEVSSHIAGPWEPVAGVTPAQAFPEPEPTEVAEPEEMPKARRKRKK